MWAERAKKVTKHTDVIHCIFHCFEQEKLICVFGLFKTLNLLKIWCSQLLLFFGVFSMILLYKWTQIGLFALWVKKTVVFILDVISIVGICCNIDFKAAYFISYRSKYQSSQINSLIWTYIPYRMDERT